MRPIAPLRGALLTGALILTGCQTPIEDPQPRDTIDTGEAAWQDYQARSDHWREVDRDHLRAEVAAEGLDQPRTPRKADGFGFDPDQLTHWYETEEGQRVADILLSFQTPSGGWSKRTNMGHRPRQPGEHFGVETHYVPTFDNGATTTQIRALARAYNATKEPRYREGYVRGIELILEAQYPSGGWPQSFPLRGGYHDHITYNDSAMRHIMVLLNRVVHRTAPFQSVPADLHEQTERSLERALDVVAASQVVVDGQPTLWGGQHHPKTLEPRPARAYEMVALATAESASLLDFLMDLEHPSEDIQTAIHAAMTWYRDNQINGYRWDTDTREFVRDEEAPPHWSRFAEIGTNRPLFGDRDGSVHYEVEDISRERREGYAWYTTRPNRVLEKYDRWEERFPHSQ